MNVSASWYSFFVYHLKAPIMRLILVALPLVFLMANEGYSQAGKSTAEKTNQAEAQSTLSKEPTNPAAAIKMLKGWQKKMMQSKDLSLHWKQVQFKALRGRYIRSHGQGFFRQPKQFFWDMKSQNLAWVFDGQYLYHLDRSNNKGVKYGRQGSQSKEIMGFMAMITRFDKITEEYVVSSVKNDDKLLSFSLIPKLKGDLNQVKVEYLKEKAIISKLHMNFVGGNYTTISFSQQSRAPLDSQVFALPKSVTIQQFP
ncbi:MAG: outer membrane lipoprotein carrier protein LolA [Proteobacteria bacterium]|nr:outer membrane lipoprotein carrier protein LolA [Pseudomonadota bacterium]